LNRKKTGGKERKSKMLVNSLWLSEHRRDPGLVLIDTRPAKDFRAGHLEGARHFDPFPFHHTDTSERGIAEFGAQLQWIFSALGISGNETVVFYEDESGMRAARGAWALEYTGHPNARMLDGTLKAFGYQPFVHGRLSVGYVVTLSLVDALIRANRDFDLVIVPNAALPTRTRGRSFFS